MSERLISRPGSSGQGATGVHDLVVAAMLMLPEQSRHVLWLAEVMGRTPGEIAPLMGISENTVSVVLERARHGLWTSYENLAHSRTRLASED